MTGCMVRYPGNASGRSRDTESGALAITMATVSQRDGTRRSAVPGSEPSGENSGTVASGRAAGPTRALAYDAAFFIEGGGATLAGAVGRRVAITGTIRAPTGDRRTPDGHASTPSATLIVDSFRTVGRSCR